ncbi:hypothetical protein ACLOJK_027518 [Asimina triloba]
MIPEALGLEPSNGNHNQDNVTNHWKSLGGERDNSEQSTRGGMNLGSAARLLSLARISLSPKSHIHPNAPQNPATPRSAHKNDCRKRRTAFLLLPPLSSRHTRLLRILAVAIDHSSAAKDLRPLNMNRTSPDDQPISEPFYQRPVFHPSPVPAAAAATEDAAASVDELLQSKKVKFLCSFGGKILPRPSDGVLRYAGGQTRIISVRRDIGFHDLVQKMTDVYGQSVVIKYQLPDEELDSLVSVSCPEDLENMMEEYEKLVEASSDGSVKLRVFLFSASELDQSGVFQFGDLVDGGQRYVDAVNGIAEGVGCGSKGKESVASASSTQNSEGLASGGEAGGGSAIGDGDGALLSQNAFSPTGVASPSDPSRLVYLPSTTAMFTEPLPSNLPPILTRPAEKELERQLASAIDIQPSVADMRPTVVYQTYMDSHQEASCTYPQNPSPIGCIGTQPLPVMGSIYRQPERQQQLSPHPFVPGLQASAAHAVQGAATVPAVQGTNLTSSQAVKPQFMQVLQMRADPYAEESQFAARGIPIPSDYGYKAFHSQGQAPQQNQPQLTVPLPGPSAERFGWHAVSPSGQPEHVICTDAWVTHQQGGVQSGDKPMHLEDCYMCQKALPHAHSDTLLKESVNNAGLMKAVPDTNAIVQSQSSDESMRPRQPVQRVFVTTAMKDGATIECEDDPGLGAEATTLCFQGAGIRPSFVGHIDPTSHGIPSCHLGPFAPSQIQDAHHENVSRSKLLPTGMVNLDAGQSNYGMYVGNLPQSYPDDALQQPAAPSQYRTIGIDIPSVRTIPVQASEPPIQDSVAIYPCKHHVFVPKGTADSCFSSDHLRPLDAWMETLRINPTDVSGIGSHIKQNVASPVESRPENALLEVVSGARATEAYPQSNSYTKPVLAADVSINKQIDALPSSLDSTLVHDFPLRSSQLIPQPGNPSAFTHPRMAAEPLIPNKMWYGVPTSSLIDPTVPVAEWKDETQRIQNRRILNEAGISASDGLQFPVPAASATGGMMVDRQDPVSSNTLFSNQDPWKLHHDAHFPPPRPVRVSSKETLTPRDVSNENHLGNNNDLRTTTQAEDGVYHQPSDGLLKDSSIDPGQSAKGSAEEKIKKELQAVAEGVAASVFQSSASPRPVVSTTEVIVDGEADQNDTAQQNSAAQDIQNKLMDKKNAVLTPVTEGISRLQIIKNADLEELRELGSGTFGTVYHGKWRGTDVAIKRINDRCFAGKPSEQERLRADFWNEACKLADLHHPNVVAFYGVVLDGPGGSIATVTEYMVNGSLRNALQRNDRNLDRRKRLFIAMDVAFGMEYLHGKNIVHFDLKSDNLLVNLRDHHRPICKKREMVAYLVKKLVRINAPKEMPRDLIGAVGDLGLSKAKCQTLISGGVRGTLPWMAPELLNGSSSLVSEKVDVFSFGIVMWELLTGEEPYADLHYGAIIEAEKWDVSSNANDQVILVASKISLAGHCAPATIPAPNCDEIIEVDFVILLTVGAEHLAVLLVFITVSNCLNFWVNAGGIVSNTLRPPVPESCDPEWRTLMEKCWSAEPSERPCFTEIADTLRSMLASLPSRGQQVMQKATHSNMETCTKVV